MLWIIATELLKSNFVNMIPFKYFYQGKFFCKNGCFVESNKEIVFDRNITIIFLVKSIWSRLFMRGEMECIIFVLLGVVDVCITFMYIFLPRLEIQYKHLLTLWRTRHWNLKQALSKEQVFTQVKVIKSTSPDKVSKIKCNLHMSKGHKGRMCLGKQTGFVYLHNTFLL